MKSLLINIPHLERYQHAPNPDWLPQLCKVIIPKNNHHIHQPILNMKCMSIKVQSSTNRTAGRKKNTNQHQQSLHINMDWDLVLIIKYQSFSSINCSVISKLYDIIWQMKNLISVYLFFRQKHWNKFLINS